MIRSLFLTTAVALTGASAHGQPPQRGTASLFGTVYDSTTGRPLPRIRICRPDGERRSPPAQCGAGDTLGHYRLDGLPAGTFTVTFFCPGPQVIGGRIDSQSVSLRPGERRRLDHPTRPDGCDLRPIRLLHALFTGHYSAGFEQSEFLFCANSAWFATADTVGMRAVRGRAWVAWPRTGTVPGTPGEWPTPRRVYPPWNYPQYFVRWFGRLEGPGQYGHMGVSPFELTVDSIVEVRTPRDDDCAAS